MKKTVLIIDDSIISQLFLKNMFQEEGWIVIGTFSSIESAENTIANESPNLISLDFNLGDHNAFSRLRKFKNILRFSDVLFVTDDNDIRNLIMMYETSACGIASKRNIDSLKKIIRSTAKGIRCYDENISNRLLQYHIDSRPLSSQEKTTFVELMSGGAINVVAEQLNLSDRTVWKHRRKIITKLGRRTFSIYCPRILDGH